MPISPKSNLMRVLSTNCDSLLNKKDELLQVADTYQADIIMVTEILPKNPGSPLTANEFLLEGYSVYTNLEDNVGRGIAIYIKEDPSHLVSNMEHNSNFRESLWLSIRLKGKDCLKLGCVYRSPSSSTVNNGDLNNLLNEVTPNDPSHLLVSGNFNYKGINGENNTADSHEEKSFLDCVQDCYLHQHVTEPTRYREGQTPSTLDLVLTNEEGMIANLMYLPGIGLSDHICLMIDLRMYTEQTPNTARYKYHRGDYYGMNQELNNIDWETQLEGKNTEESWTYFAEIFNSSTRKFIPMGHRKAVKKKKLWMTKDATRHQKKKYHAWKRFKETGAYADQLAAKKEALALTTSLYVCGKTLKKTLRKTPTPPPPPQSLLALQFHPDEDTGSYRWPHKTGRGTNQPQQREGWSPQRLLQQCLHQRKPGEHAVPRAQTICHASDNSGDYPRQSEEETTKAEKDQVCRTRRLSPKSPTGMCWWTSSSDVSKG